MLFLALNAVDMLLIHSLREILHAHEYISGMFESQSYCRPIFLPSIIFFRDEFPRMATIKHNKMYTYELRKVAGNRAQMLNTCYVNFFHPHRTHTVELWMYRRIPAPCYASMCCWISMRFEQEFSSCARIVRRWWFCDRIYNVGDGDGRVEDKSHVRAINL